MKVEDKDIATVEALHDMLLDNYGLSIDHPTLVKSRKLTSKMYADIGYYYKDKQVKNASLFIVSKS